MFEAVIAAATTPAQADDRRLLCEYFCNPEFKGLMHDYVASVNQVPRRP